MNPEQPSDEIHVAELANRLREKTKPLCPQFRSCNLEGLYPVRGHCVLSRSPGWFMIPSIEEYRTYCTSRGFVLCPWFGQTAEAAGPVEDESGAHPARTEAWGPPR
jgi:hypothetical protein